MFVLVEDNRNFGIIIRDYLFTNHGQIEWVETVAQAKLLIARHHKTISCAIVDWMLPDGDGPTLCRWIKDQYSIPVILSTARSQIDDKLEGFDSGADDYLTKPYDLRELSARINALIHRRQNIYFSSGSITIDPEAMMVFVGDVAIECGPNERHALKCFCDRWGKVVSRIDLIDTIWGGDNRGAENNLDVLISSLRKKLGKEAIVTVKGIGYRMGEEKQ